MNKNTTYRLVPISEIRVKDRLREDYGDVSDLAANIKQLGLLHPITIDDDSCLIAGERRLRACASLGWKEIRAKVYSDLTDAEKLEVEVSENTKRKALTEGELAKRLGQAERADGVYRRVSNNSPKRGRPTKGQASKAEVAGKVGVSAKTLKRAEQHAAALEKYPELKGKPQREVLREYDKREGKAKQTKPAAQPEVVKVSEFKFAGEHYGMMDRLIEDGRHKTRNEVLVAGLTLYYAKALEVPEAVLSVKATAPTSPNGQSKLLAAGTSEHDSWTLTAVYDKGTWYCAQCGRVLPTERATPARLKNPCNTSGCRGLFVQA